MVLGIQTHLILSFTMSKHLPKGYLAILIVCMVMLVSFIKFYPH